MKKASTRLLSILLAAILLVGLTAPVLADGTLIVGEVTITNSTSVNIRSGGSTQYPIIAVGAPGEVFQTTGQVASGWYEILLPNNVYGYISNNLVFFSPYAVPVPIGGAQQYTLPVYYRTSSGQLIKQVMVPVTVGQNIITADDSQVPGYRLVSTRSVYVSVDASGRANPAGVIFSYELQYTQPTQTPVSNVTIAIYYRNNYNQIVATEYRPLRQGTQLVKADLSKLPQGYVLSGASDQVVTVSSYGTASPSFLTFDVILSSPPAVSTPVPAFQVPVSYQDEQGRVLHNTSQNVNVGYTTVTANDSLVPGGMQLVSARSVVVYCSSTGVTFPKTVVFTYRSSVSANIQVVYQDALGMTLNSEYRQLSQGTQTITADDSKVPAGYILQGNRSVQVTVYSNGTVSQNRVVFVYAQPAQVNVPVYYRDSNGNLLYSESRALGQGTTTITANDGNVPSGYILQSNRSVQVTVYANGAAYPNQVVFTYSKPVSATVQILYRDNNGNNLFSETRTFQQGTHTITANDGRAPSGYVLQSDRNVRVTVYADGRVNPGQIIFTYAPPAPPVTVRVPIYYKDHEGAILSQTAMEVSSSSPMKIVANPDRVPAGYVPAGPTSITVTVSPNGVAKPSEVVFVYRDPSTITEAQLLPKYDTFSFSGSAKPVYSGPGTEYYRANNGKASVQGGRLRVWGTIGDWALIGYGLSNNLYRVGYISRSALPSSVSVPELYLGSEVVKTVNLTQLNDDPIVNPVKIMEIPKGTDLILLAYMDDRWAYVETTFNNQPIRGFVRRHNISKP